MVFASGCVLFAFQSALALDRTNEVFKIFQFPTDKIPCIDGITYDWDIGPEIYAIGSEQLVDD